MFKLAESRKKYDWLFIISDNGLEKEFDHYVKKHSGISIKRAARGFVLKKKLAYKWPCYEKHNIQAREDYFQHLALVNWIED